jgi:hypothetical protein
MSSLEAGKLASLCLDVATAGAPATGVAVGAEGGIGDGVGAAAPLSSAPALAAGLEAASVD